MGVCALPPPSCDTPPLLPVAKGLMMWPYQENRWVGFGLNQTLNPSACLFVALFMACSHRAWWVLLSCHVRHTCPFLVK